MPRYRPSSIILCLVSAWTILGTVLAIIDALTPGWRLEEDESFAGFTLFGLQGLALFVLLRVLEHKFCRSSGPPPLPPRGLTSRCSGPAAGVVSSTGQSVSSAGPGH